MSETKPAVTKKIQQTVRTYLALSPLRPTTLIAIVLDTMEDEVTTREVRHELWHMLSVHDLRTTPDLRVELTDVQSAA